MNYFSLRLLAFTLAAIILLTGCDFIGSAFEYRDKAEEFVEKLLQEDYDGCVELMALNHEAGEDTNVETLKQQLPMFRDLIVSSFGDDLNYTFMEARKSTAMQSNTTLLYIEFDNKKEFGVFQVLFDDTSKKIINIKPLDVKKPIPSLVVFWFCALAALCVLIFNVFVIIQVKRSNLQRKWLKYFVIMLLNVPTIGYSVVNGFVLQPLQFQFLFGFGISMMGYLGTTVALGIPLGGLYWFWKLKKQKKQLAEAVDQLDSEIIDRENT